MDIMPINKSTYTAKVEGIEVEPESYIEHDPEIVFADSAVSTSLSLWSLSGTSITNKALYTSLPHSEPYSYIFYRSGTGAAGDTIAARTVSGLVIGASYTLAAWVRKSNSSATGVKLGVEGIGQTATFVPPSYPNAFASQGYTFTATSTSHVIQYVMTATSGSSPSFPLDDITVTRDAYTETVPAVVGFPLEVKSAEVTLDETRAPYVQADLTCALPPQAALEAIDPRSNIRVTVTATQEWIQPVRAPQTRTFDLLLHERTIDHDEAELTLRLVSDEALAIDAGNDTTSPTRIYGLSVKDAVDSTLTGLGFALEAGAEDATLAANPPTLPVITNTIPNPTFRTSLGNWSAGGSGNTIARITGLSPTPVEGVTTYSRNTWTGTGTGGPYTRGDSLSPYITVVAGQTYIITAWVRANVTKDVAINIQYDSTGTTPNFVGSTVALVANEWTLLKQRVNVPVGATRAGLYSYQVGASWVSGNRYETLGWQMTLDQEYPFFDGATIDTGLDTYAWTGTAGASTSTRTNLLNSDVFIQTPGALDWDYVAPLVQAGGLRLFCDEQRKWRLIDPLTYSVPGQINVAAGTNATSGKDTISRQLEDWFDAVVVEYRWTDDDGLPQVAYDAASNGGTKLLRKVIERPFPGAGAAASILALYSGRGRTLDVEALTDLDATPGMALVMTMPGTPIQVGVVSSVTWKWSAEGDSDEMRIGSRGLLDTPSTAWLLQPEGYKWQDIPVGQSWTEYETPS